MLHAIARRLLSLSSALALAAVACDGVAPAPTGRLSASLSLTTDAAHDVSAMDYKVVPKGATCDATAIAQRRVPAPAANGGRQTFDAFFVLPPGDYHVCVTPMGGETPSRSCGRAESDATVTPQKTTEIILVSQCRGNPNGGLDVATTLNDPPSIDDLAIRPSKFISTCDQATLAATASDPNGDALSYAWAIVDGPTGGALVSPTGNPATFSATTAGDYTVQLTVSDSHGANVSLTFPMHVAPGNCGGPGTVGVIDGAPYRVCRSNDQTAWISSTGAGGHYNAVLACQSLGYFGVDAWGGNCGTECGYCGKPGVEFYDMNAGVDPASLAFQVTWRCAR